MPCRLDILSLHVSVLLHIASYGDKKIKKNMLLFPDEYRIAVA
jgi:hypothetical protein